MARPRKDIGMKELIEKQEGAVAKAKEKYDLEVTKLKDLYAKRDEEKKKELLKAVESSGKSYDEIMTFLRERSE